MKFSFEVGHVEKYIVEFEFDQFSGNLSIKVDGKDRINDFRIASFELTKTYEFEVGNEEVHQVKIEKIRKLILAGFRKSKYKVYIDGILCQEYEGR